MDVGKREKGRKGGVEREGRGVEERERWDERGREGRDERGEERKGGREGWRGGEGRTGPHIFQNMAAPLQTGRCVAIRTSFA